MIAVQKPILIALAVLLFFVFNAFNNLVLKDARLDLTEGQLYTLSEGSLNPQKHKSSNKGEYI